MGTDEPHPRLLHCNLSTVIYQSHLKVHFSILEPLLGVKCCRACNLLPSPQILYMMSISTCCLTGSEWKRQPTGQEGEIAGLNTCVSRSSKETAVVIIHDLFGWKFPNTRLLADHYASDAGATVYVPDFFGGHELSREVFLSGDFSKLELNKFMEKNNRYAREPERFEVAKALRAKYTTLHAVGVLLRW